MLNITFCIISYCYNILLNIILLYHSSMQNRTRTKKKHKFYFNFNTANLWSKSDWRTILRIWTQYYWHDSLVTWRFDSILSSKRSTVNRCSGSLRNFSRTHSWLHISRRQCLAYSLNPVLSNRPFSRPELLHTQSHCIPANAPIEL